MLDMLESAAPEVSFLRWPHPPHPPVPGILPGLLVAYNSELVHYRLPIDTGTMRSLSPRLLLSDIGLQKGPQSNSPVIRGLLPSLRLFHIATIGDTI